MHNQCVAGVKLDGLAVSREAGHQVGSPSNRHRPTREVVAGLEYCIIGERVEVVFAINQSTQASQDDFEEWIQGFKTAYPPFLMNNPSVSGSRAGKDLNRVFATRTLATFARIKRALLFERRRPCRYDPGPATLKKAVTNHLTRSFRGAGDQDSLVGEFSCCRKRIITTRSFSPLYKRIDWTPVSRTRRRRSELSTKHGSYASSQELNRP